MNTNVGRNTPRVAVIGGGIAGLTAAYELRKQLGPDARILIVEAYDRLGGKLKTVNFSTGPVDMGAEAYLGFRQDFTALLEELGLGDALRTPSGLPSGLFVEGALVDAPKDTVMGIPASGDAVRQVLGEQAAQRIDAERTGEAMTWTPGQDTTVGQLVEARLGRAVVDQLVSPMLGGVYSCSADDLSVRATVPQVAAELDRWGEKNSPFYLVDVIDAILDKRRQAPASGPVFRSIDGGYAAVVDALIDAAKPEILYNAGVESLSRTSRGWYVEPIGEFDAAVVATPAPTAGVLVKDVAPVASDALASVELASSVVVGMRLASDHGIPQRSGVLLGEHAPTEAKAFTFSSRKWPHLNVEGGSIVRASFGTLQQPWYLEADDRALLSYAVDDLEKVTGERKQPQEFFVQRWWGGLPCYGVGHMERMGQALNDVEGVAGLALAGAAYQGVGVPATAQSGVAAARKIVQDLS
ncbi:FAD-dependent oxidoreductase [Corynebacterium sp. 320]|uniref:FAD-dependent oxidoreductase n=1 Tax=Corynebacterium TaxID=1716 RepID=UPI00125CCA3F|nr:MULTISPECIES: FAD-dependent oxidoreductase [Corynebacterium]KAB1503736.1 FAD-dependent oxidoreductase [Corynebacterium sp. 320]KAB1553164.1 FAD-dependent oxidoreductase [Corynebacterium sp. 321]KAB1553618.1 FAD-dependent oxidoreductase [Corynebacterium sp. 319]KAB3527872.1 FAD-dependent oxidoreductase [Corynebacterium sp. 250]KAB3540639.1 FAD-dependent oxidoreductase [Corynebacterium sp. 366]